jgi:hypothetical protein
LRRRVVARTGSVERRNAVIPFWLPLAVTFFVILAFMIPGFIIISLTSLQTLNRSPSRTNSVRAWLAIVGVFLCVVGVLLVANGAFLLWTGIPFYFVQGIVWLFFGALIALAGPTILFRDVWPLRPIANAFSTSSGQ